MRWPQLWMNKSWQALKQQVLQLRRNNRRHYLHRPWPSFPRVSEKEVVLRGFQVTDKWRRISWECHQAAINIKQSSGRTGHRAKSGLGVSVLGWTLSLGLPPLQWHSLYKSAFPELHPLRLWFPAFRTLTCIMGYDYDASSTAESMWEQRR